MAPALSQAQTKSVVGFIDMDCFYVAVERRRDPSLFGVPCAVVQYNSRIAGGAPELPPEANRRVSGDTITGGIIAVSYEARQRGVTRQMNGQEARKQCPEIVLVQVPTAFGKADLKIYKQGGNEVVSLLAQRAGSCEKRSVDEVAIDITAEAERMLRERSFEDDLLPAAKRASHLADSALSRTAAAVSRDDTRKGHCGQQAREIEGDKEPDTDEAAETAAQQGPWEIAKWDPRYRRLIAGAVVVDELRATVEKELGYTCSGGIAENKMLAKLGCGLHKPKQQTIVFPCAVSALLHGLPLERIQGLGGDLGTQVKEQLQVSTASELAQIPLERLEFTFPGKGAFLHGLATGTHNDPVQDRELCKSLSGSKTFVGRLALRNMQESERWLRELAGELHRRYCEDLAEHARSPTKISVSVAWGTGTSAETQRVRSASEYQHLYQHASRQASLDLGRNGSVDQIVRAALACFQRWAPQTGSFNITMLGLSLSNFRPVFAGPDSHAPLSKFFGAQSSSAASKAKSMTTAGAAARTATTTTKGATTTASTAATAGSHSAVAMSATPMQPTAIKRSFFQQQQASSSSSTTTTAASQPAGGIAKSPFEDFATRSQAQAQSGVGGPTSEISGQTGHASQQLPKSVSASPSPVPQTIPAAVAAPTSSAATSVTAASPPSSSSSAPSKNPTTEAEARRGGEVLMIDVDEEDEGNLVAEENAPNHASDNGSSIDPDVFAALPGPLQAEVLAQLPRSEQDRLKVRLGQPTSSQAAKRQRLTPPTAEPPGHHPKAPPTRPAAKATAGLNAFFRRQGPPG